MPNPIKYNASAETLALQKGNFWIGTGAVGKGPTSTTGYYNGITPPSGGYTLYLNKASGGPSIYCPANDAALISLTNSIAGAAYTTAQECFNYYYTQTDKMCLSQDYPADFPYIVLDGLVFYVDAGVTLSYPGSGTTWTDINGLGPKNNGTLTNGPTFSSANGGSIVFDGADDSIVTPNGNVFFSGKSQVTVCVWFKLTSSFRPNLINIPIGSGGTFSIENGSESANTLLTYFNNNNPTSFPFDLNTIYQIVSIFNSGSVTTYKNGVLIGTTTNNNSTLNTVGTTNLVIGRWGWVFGNSIIGNVYITQIYNRALSAAEVLQNFNAQKSRFGL